MSGDEYPTCDVLNVRTIVPRLRQPIGAASLLFRNQAQRWPAFEGRDLSSRYPGIAFSSLAREGVTLSTIASQLTSFRGEDRGEGLLLTLTVGGNDLLTAASLTVHTVDMQQTVQQAISDYAALVRAIRDRLPQATILLSTLYDLSARTGRLSRVSDYFGEIPGPVLDRFNQQVAALAPQIPGVLVAELHRHLKADGPNAQEMDRWYWRHSLVEPSAPGASEIRRVWLETLGI